MTDTAEIRRTWKLLPSPARHRILKNAAISAGLNAGFVACGPWLIAQGRLPHNWEELKALLLLFGYGAVMGLYLHFQNPGLRRSDLGRRRPDREA